MSHQLAGQMKRLSQYTLQLSSHSQGLCFRTALELGNLQHKFKRTLDGLTTGTKSWIPDASSLVVHLLGAARDDGIIRLHEIIPHTLGALGSGSIDCDES